MKRNKDTTSRRVEELLKYIRQNRFCLPSFQRQFVWKPKQMAKLIESIVRHYPIGTLMLLRRKGNSGLGEQPFDEHTSGYMKPQWYVIDGQQRLKTLLYTLMRPRTADAKYVYLGHPYRFSYKADERLTTIDKSEDVDSLSFIFH